MSGSRRLPPPCYAIVALISVISQMFKTGRGGRKAWAPAAVLLFHDMKTFLQALVPCQEASAHIHWLHQGHMTIPSCKRGWEKRVTLS